MRPSSPPLTGVTVHQVVGGQSPEDDRFSLLVRRGDGVWHEDKTCADLSEEAAAAALHDYGIAPNRIVTMIASARELFTRRGHA